MKKGLVFLAFALVGVLSFGQSLHKGSLLGLHTYTPSLKDGVTMEEYIKFVRDKGIPAYEKAFPGLKMYLVRSIRGQDSTSLGMLYLFENEGDRNKYFNDDGTMTDLGKAASEKLTDIGKEFEKYEVSTNAPDKYNDWLVE
jgi:hypothetical protein